MTPLSDYLDFARQTAWEAGRLTLGYYQTGVHAEFKGDDSPVTIADREAERLIRKRIQSEYPDHSIVGEEYGVSASAGATRRWIIDPIDGTKSFVHGVPLYGVLIGLEIEGTPAVGIAYFPALDEMLSAATGLGAWWNGRRCRVSEVDQLDRRRKEPLGTDLPPPRIIMPGGAMPTGMPWWRLAGVRPCLIR